MTAPRPAHARARLIGEVVAVAVLYAGAAASLLARHALSDPSQVCLCIGHGDPPAYMWALRWWPFALTHGHNPFYTHYIWSPSGVNVAAAPEIPLPSVLMWPFTALAGPLVSYDLLALASPAVAGAAMYLLCRHVTGSRLASLAGGWLFGFSSYELSELVGHADLMLVALLPLAALLVLLRLEARVGQRLFVLAIAVIAAAQLLTSAEVLASAAMLGAVAFAIVALRAGAQARARLGRTAGEIVVGGAIASVLTSPYLYYAVVLQRPGGPTGGTQRFGTDLSNLVVPTAVTLLHYGSSIAARLPGNLAEQGAYFGVPLLIAFVAAVHWLRRRTAGVLLGGVALVAVVLSLGAHLVVDGHSSIPLPWAALDKLPVLSAMIPDRLIVYAWLAVAVGLAMWLAAPGRGWWRLLRWAVVLAGVVLVLPNGASSVYAGVPDVPALFTGSGYSSVVAPGSVMLALPYGVIGDSMVWQADADFHFSMPEGYISTVYPSQFHQPVVAALLSAPGSVTGAQLKAFIVGHDVATVVVDQATAGTWPMQLAAAGLTGRVDDGAIVYQVPAAWKSAA